jgi:hypothetical protein
VQANRSLEAELIELLTTAMPDQDEARDQFGQELAGLQQFDDEALLGAARSHLSTAIARRLERLHRKRQREGLSETEAQALHELVRQYERAMLIRAHAAALLKKRGLDVSVHAGVE